MSMCTYSAVQNLQPPGAHTLLARPPSPRAGRGGPAPGARGTRTAQAMLFFEFWGCVARPAALSLSLRSRFAIFSHYPCVHSILRNA